MQVIEDIRICRDAVCAARATGQTVGLVPTMGALHDAHRSLIRSARNQCGFVAVSIFVNPRQFGPGEDFDVYPRVLDEDLTVCRDEGVDLVFTPTAEAMFPNDDATTIRVDGVTAGLCGAARPGHFDGVATVVMKLFQIIPADRAYFGEKDYQQLVVVRRMVQALNVAVDIVGCPIVRESNGLAMSSRNRYLSSAERDRAASINRALCAAAERIRQGESSVSTISAQIREELSAAGSVVIEYVEIVDAESLAPIDTIDRAARICVAVRIGPCRLIDNVSVDDPGQAG